MSKDVELLEKYNETWEKVKNSIKKEFDSEPVFYDKYLKAKLKSFQGKINTNFHDNEISKGSSQFICLSVIYLFISFIYLFICLFVSKISSVFRTGKNYYPQSKFVIKEKNARVYYCNNIEISFDDSDI